MHCHPCSRMIPIQFPGQSSVIHLIESIARQTSWSMDVKGEGYNGPIVDSEAIMPLFGH